MWLVYCDFRPATPLWRLALREHQPWAGCQVQDSLTYKLPHVYRTVSIYVPYVEDGLNLQGGGGWKGVE